MHKFEKKILHQNKPFFPLQSLHTVRNTFLHGWVGYSNRSIGKTSYELDLAVGCLIDPYSRRFSGILFSVLDHLLCQCAPTGTLSLPFSVIVYSICDTSIEGVTTTTATLDKPRQNLGNLPKTKLGFNQALEARFLSMLPSFLPASQQDLRSTIYLLKPYIFPLLDPGSYPNTLAHSALGQAVPSAGQEAGICRNT